ncbi:hypothetical protein XCR_2621 [Xanthomonas campestris pv. raphani 756C]|nr:hypothetical protein XCR_2621 [Xanthomonas campestris pv. raphani 756C]
MGRPGIAAGLHPAYPPHPRLHSVRPLGGGGRLRCAAASGTAKLTAAVALAASWLRSSAA